MSLIILVYQPMLCRCSVSAESVFSRCYLVSLISHVELMFLVCFVACAAGALELWKRRRHKFVPFATWFHRGTFAAAAILVKTTVRLFAWAL